MDQLLLSLLTNGGLLSFLALSAWLLLRAGAVSFGQQGFFAVGAYAGGMGTVMAGLALAPALALAALAGAVAGGVLALLTRRLRGVGFAVASLAAAEALRVGLELFRWRVPGPDGRPVGPDGVGGFGGIRYLYATGYTAADMALLVVGVLALVLVALAALSRTRWGLALRMAGEDPVLATALGVAPRRARFAATVASGAVAALGGALFAHYATYVEPDNFAIMQGLHGLFYALIGGVATPLGPLVGVAFDLGLMEGGRLFQGYRMIAFGVAVSVLLTVRPCGLLDERMVRRLRAAGRRARPTLFPRPRSTGPAAGNTESVP